MPHHLQKNSFDFPIATGMPLAVPKLHVSLLSVSNRTDDFQTAGAERLEVTEWNWVKRRLGHVTLLGQR